MPGIFIGAHLDLVASRATGKQRFYYPVDKDGKLTKRVVFSSDIVASIQAGELLACNKADALLCGITDKEFLEPEKALEVEKEKALDYYRALLGTDAKVADIPREPTPEPEDGKAPPQTAAKQITPTVKLTKNTES